MSYVQQLANNKGKTWFHPDLYFPRKEISNVSNLKHQIVKKKLLLSKKIILVDYLNSILNCFIEDTYYNAKML